MRHGSLFSGIGGFDLAAEWMGWENVFHCEWNEFGQKVLKYYWPNAESFTDITKTDFTKYEGTIDLISGGFPCQPYSQAGKRLGKEDDRHLWPEMLRAIREVKPSWVVGENVYGLVNWSGGLVFHEVQADLEAEGYEVWPFLLPAVSVNAPHRRDRIWFVAYSNTNRLNKYRGYECSGKNDERGKISGKWSANTEEFNTRNTSTNIVRGQRIDGATCTKKNGKKDQFAYPRRICDLDKTDNQSKDAIKNDRNQINDSCSLVQNGQEWVQLSKYTRMGENKNDCKSTKMVRQKNDRNEINRMEWDASNSNGNGLNQCNSKNEVNTSEGRVNAFSNINKSNDNGNATDTNGIRCDNRINNREERYLSGDIGITKKSKSERKGWECRIGEISAIDKYTTNSNCTDNKTRTQRKVLGQSDREKTNGYSNVECSNKWQNFPTVSPICSGDDGLSNRLDSITFPKWRNESIKAGGNAIVPQVVYQIFKAIEQYEHQRPSNTTNK